MSSHAGPWLGAGRRPMLVLEHRSLFVPAPHRAPPPGSCRAGARSCSRNAYVSARLRSACWRVGPAPARHRRRCSTGWAMDPWSPPAASRPAWRTSTDQHVRRWIPWRPAAPDRPRPPAHGSRSLRRVSAAEGRQGLAQRRGMDDAPRRTQTPRIPPPPLPRSTALSAPSPRSTRRRTCPHIPRSGGRARSPCHGLPPLRHGSGSGGGRRTGPARVRRTWPASTASPGGR